MRVSCSSIGSIGPAVANNVWVAMVSSNYLGFGQNMLLIKAYGSDWMGLNTRDSRRREHESLTMADDESIRQVFAGQAVGIKEVHDDIWLVSFMIYHLGYFDLAKRVLEPLENPFGPKVLPMS